MSEVRGFFSRFKLSNASIHIFRKQKFSMECDGTCLVLFEDENEAIRAVIEKDRQYLNGRKVSLFHFI